MWLVRVLNVLFLLPLVVSAYSQKHVFSIMEWNCENLFDCQHDTLKNDYEWLPDADRQWVAWRYWKKLNIIGQTIIASGEYVNNDKAIVTDTVVSTLPNDLHSSFMDANSEGLLILSDSFSSWNLPDIVLLTEVENDSVLVALTQRSLLRKARYEYVMTDSPNERGIDIAMLYSPFTFMLTYCRSLSVPLLKGMPPTRDILYAKGVMLGGDTLHVFGIHAPSRTGGERHTRPFRMAVMNCLIEAVDSIRQHTPDANIVIAGDFNDYSDSQSMRLLCKSGFVELSYNACGSNGARGTYRYRGEWGSLDHIFSSQRLANHLLDCIIFDAPYLIQPDETYGGVKPRRTYLGSFYNGGVSDHLPLIARFSLY